MSEAKRMPKDPTPAMCEAMEAYYRKWAGILGGSDDHVKAQCWATLHAYRVMFEACDGDPGYTISGNIPEVKIGFRNGGGDDA